MITHSMEYRAGRSGLADIGMPDRDPTWTCSCGAGWSFPAKAMPTRKTGDNAIEATRAHDRHVGAIR